MPTVLLSTFGTRGDVAPVLAVARALCGEGARVVLLLNPHDTPWAEREGLEARPVGPLIDVGREVWEHPEHVTGVGAGARVIRDLYLPFTRHLLLAARQALTSERPAVVASHVGCFGSAWAAREAGVPTAVLHLAPQTLLAPTTLAVHAWPRRVLFWALMPLALWAFVRSIRAVARDLGFRGKGNPFLDAALRADLLVGLWSPRFRAPAAGDSPRLRVCGFPRTRLADEATVPGAVERFLAQGPPPVAVGLGTSVAHADRGLFASAAEACARLDRRALLFAPEPPPGPPGGGLCGTALAIPFAPFDEVFPACAAVIHHGGMGTSASVLRAGVPSVVVPLAHDQLDNASRLRRLGVAVEVSRRRATPRRLTASLAQVLEPERQDRARRLGAPVAAEPDGAVDAARAILPIPFAPSMRAGPFVAMALPAVALLFLAFPTREVLDPFLNLVL